jgi:hypothetical protein
MQHRFPNTPSSGQVEARAALARANARGSRLVPLRKVQRFVPVRTRSSLQAVLTALVAAGDAATSSGSYRLTTQGLDKFRHHPNPRYMAAVGS